MANCGMEAAQGLGLTLVMSEVDGVMTDVGRSYAAAMRGR